MENDSEEKNCTWDNSSYHTVLHEHDKSKVVYTYESTKLHKKTKKKILFSKAQLKGSQLLFT